MRESTLAKGPLSVPTVGAASGPKANLLNISEHTRGRSLTRARSVGETSVNQRVEPFMKNSTLDRNPMRVLFVREASGIKVALPLIEKFTVVRSPTDVIGVEKPLVKKEVSLFISESTRA